MKIKWHLSLVIVIFFVAIIGGAYFYSFAEGWGLFNSFYFVIITVTTIGYGDIAPVTIAGKSLTMFLAFFGVAIALYLITQIGSYITKKHISSQVGTIKRDVKQQEEIKQDIKDVIKKNLGKKF